MLRIITNHLSEREIPCALIGAFAWILYKFPKFTVDIDLVPEGRFWPEISSPIDGLGHTCLNQTKNFAIESLFDMISDEPNNPEKHTL